jgi:hypothetical protein
LGFSEPEQPIERIRRAFRDDVMTHDDERIMGGIEDDRA